MILLTKDLSNTDLVRKQYIRYKYNIRLLLLYYYLFLHLNTIILCIGVTKKSNVVYIELFNDGDGDADGIPHLGSTNIPLDSKFTIDSYKEKAGTIYPVDMHIIKIDYRNTFSRVLQGPLYRMVRDTFRVKGTLVLINYEVMHLF